MLTKFPPNITRFSVSNRFPFNFFVLAGLEKKKTMEKVIPSEAFALMENLVKTRVQHRRSWRPERLFSRIICHQSYECDVIYGQLDKKLHSICYDVRAKLSTTQFSCRCRANIFLTTSSLPRRSQLVESIGSINSLTVLKAKFPTILRNNFFKIIPAWRRVNEANFPLPFV